MSKVVADPDVAQVPLADLKPDNQSRYAIRTAPQEIDEPRPAYVVAAYAVAAVAAYGVAQLSWRYFERPLLERGRSAEY